MFERFRPRGAVLFMLISGVFYACVHAGVKLVSRIPAHEIAVFRALVSLGLTWVACRRAGLSPWGINRPMLVFRGLAGTGALILYFHTLQSMPLASAVTIQYLHPILTVLFAAFLLREKATPVQWVCFAMSFVGVLLVKGIDTRVTPLDLAIGVASAVCSAVAYNLIRALRDEDHALVVMFYLPLVSLCLIGPWTAFHFVQPEGWEWPALVAIGILTQIAQYFMTLAYQSESAANISNLNYLGILYATALGYMFFNEPLQWLAGIGIAVIIGSAILSVKMRSHRSPPKDQGDSPSIAPPA